MKDNDRPWKIALAIAGVFIILTIADLLTKSYKFLALELVVAIVALIVFIVMYIKNRKGGF